MSDRLYITDQDGNTLRIDGAIRVKCEPPRRSTFVTVYFESQSETVLDEVSTETAQQARDAIHRLLVRGEGTVDLRDYKHMSSPGPTAPDASGSSSGDGDPRSEPGNPSRERPRSVHRTAESMRAFSLTLALLLASALPTYAQDTEAEIETVIVQQAIVQSTTAAPLTAEEAFSDIRAFGLSEAEGQALDGFSLGAQGNLALLRQTGYSVFLGVGNAAVIDQSGDGNLTVLIQEGAFNSASTRQAGSGNVVGIRLRGVGNQLGTPTDPGIRQEGTENIYLLDFAGDFQTIAPTEQVGNGNQVVQLGPIDAPFGVQQYGDGMRMIIRHNGAEQ